MKTTAIATLLLVAGASLTSCHSEQSKDRRDTTVNSNARPSGSDTAGTPANKAGSEDPSAQFISEAAVSGLLENEMGRIGQQKAQLQAIKDYAVTIERDHKVAGTGLAEIAKAKNLTLPLTISAEKQEHLTDLSQMTGKDFDSYYTNMMVENHLTDIALFEGASKSPDTAVSHYALKLLPTLQKHYKQARELASKFDQNKR
ncbi:DUF4142 domain-containing protein [Pedobacter antarcticus]|uniref:DUF4142 domain-containing protein n=1 Tax=Pedobacter antarcticus TaxID=34086 RepID=UPI0008885231|nr:DUF4142 domain-containing protein [Pedobacter antarcticus]SDL41620.1 protein of unknown function [Pedobacter antarcticus]